MRSTFLTVFILVTGTLRAGYEPPSLNELIIKADRIIYGTIQCVDDRIIEVKLEGSSYHNDQTISINKFQEWNCGKRWSEYRVGQMSIFFLSYKEDGFYPMGGGNEGEIPLHGGQAYVHYSTISHTDEVKIFNRSEKQVEENGYNNPYGGYVLPLEGLWEAIKTVKKCFKADISATGTLTNIRSICSGNEYKNVLANNKIFGWAFNDLMRSNRKQELEVVMSQGNQTGDSVCYSHQDINNILKAIISDEKYGKPFFLDLQFFGRDTIKVASNYEVGSRNMTINGRAMHFIPDTNIRLPRIILALEKNCDFGKFEFSFVKYSIIGTISKRNELNWDVQITGAIEID